MNNKVNLFILTPENNPQFNWICNSNQLIDQENAIEFLKNLELYKSCIITENYDGYYDDFVFKELVGQFEIIDDLFPNPIRRRLINLFKDFYSWRENSIQKGENTYQIFNHHIVNHTLCEISQRKNDINNENFALLNHVPQNNRQIEIIINQEHNNIFEVLSDESSLLNWFSENRIPKRKFQAIPKHNIPKPIWVKGKKHSPLYKSEVDPTEILKTAIGQNRKELFGYDSDKKMFIVFKYENVEHENQYHGYHVELDSDEVPDLIKTKLL